MYYVLRLRAKIIVKMKHDPIFYTTDFNNFVFELKIKCNI